MELHQLEYVIKVAEHMNFTHAAEELHLAQPSLSKQISKLEDELGVRIFERSTRSVKLTPAGKEFITSAKRVLVEVSRTRHAMQEYIAVEKGRLLIGAMPMIGYLGLTKLIADFKMKYPSVDIEIKEAGSLDLLQMLYTSEIDLALMSSSLDGIYFKTSLDFYPLMRDEIVLLTPPLHPLAERGQIEVSELADQRWILPPSAHTLHHIILNLCRDAGFEPRVVCESSQAETTAGLVAAGLGITLLSRRVSSALSQHSFSMIKVNPSTYRSTALVVPADLQPQPAITAFKDFTLVWAKENLRASPL